MESGGPASTSTFNFIPLLPERTTNPIPFDLNAIQHCDAHYEAAVLATESIAKQPRQRLRALRGSTGASEARGHRKSFDVRRAKRFAIGAEEL